MRLLPRDEKFLGMFSAVAAVTVESPALLHELLRADAPHRTAIVDQIVWAWIPDHPDERGDRGGRVPGIVVSRGLPVSPRSA